MANQFDPFGLSVSAFVIVPLDAGGIVVVFVLFAQFALAFAIGVVVVAVVFVAGGVVPGAVAVFGVVVLVVVVPFVCVPVVVVPFVVTAAFGVPLAGVVGLAGMVPVVAVEPLQLTVVEFGTAGVPGVVVCANAGEANAARNAAADAQPRSLEECLMLVAPRNKLWEVISIPPSRASGPAEQGTPRKQRLPPERRRGILSVCAPHSSGPPAATVGPLT